MPKANVPYARVVYHLSRTGIRDALKRGLVTDGLVEFLVHPGDDQWSDVFDLGPDLVHDSDDEDVAVGVSLIVGRDFQLQQPNSSPVDIDSIGLVDPMLVWRRPGLIITLGDAQQQDYYFELEEILEIEATFRQARAEEIEKHRTILESTRSRWREWIMSEGLINANRLIHVGESLEDDFLSPRDRDELSDSIQALRSCIGELNPADDDSLSAFSDTVATAYATVEQKDAQIEAAKDRTQELADAKNWVQAYGSSRLRKAVATGLLTQSMGAYRDERLSIEHPLWSWWDPKTDSAKSIVNPSEEDLDALMKARGFDERARLIFFSGQGPTVTASYLGRQIKCATVLLSEPF